MYRKVISMVKVTLCSMALIGLFAACGSTTNVEGVESTVNNEVVESTTVVESEPTTTESEANTETDVVEESKEAITETNVAVESEVALGEGDKDPNFNGAGHEGTLEQTVQSYITYEDIEPTTMYVTKATSTYHDPNISEGELVVSGLTEPNQEILIDGKATLNGVDYYRIVFQPEMMLNHQIIIPAEFVSDKPQEVEVQQQPEVQQPEVQQPTQTPPPASEPEIPEWDSSLGVSKEEWDAFFGGSTNTTGQHTWDPGNGSDFKSSVNENGGLDLTGGNLDPSEVGGLTFH